MINTLLSLGHGFSARALTPLLLSQGWRIFGTTRNADKAEAIRDSGVTPLIWPGTDLPLDQASHLLISAGPTADGDPVLAMLRETIAVYADHFDWVGYLSATGVYGDHQGGWVDEATPLTPATRRGTWRVAAEADWQSIPGLPLHIFRLAGIYGPGRDPLTKVKNGTARQIIKPGQVFNRIHVDDIAQVLRASIARPNPGAIYNLCDDAPSPPQDVIVHAAELLGVPLPPAVPFETADMTPMAHSFYVESKRVRNDRIKNELGITLRYPDYRTGLAALLDAEHAAD
ncbi:MAG: SDR family oxidoreductase [Rhodobacteraceae bacterium]|nr:SDR family oxidoreductase [Paracoccaceae bacterium]